MLFESFTRENDIERVLYHFVTTGDGALLLLFLRPRVTSSNRDISDSQTRMKQPHLHRLHCCPQECTFPGSLEYDLRRFSDSQKALLVTNRP